LYVTIRTDVDVNFELDPRLAEISLGAGQDEISVQDSHDTLTTLQDSVTGSEYPELVTTAGGEALGGGTSVGLTTTLDNVQYAPAATSPRCSGTATSTDPLGITLTDTGATFQTDLVQRGDWVINFTDQSVSEVLSVTSETELVTRGLRNGTANTFTSSDAYKVWEVAEFQLSGGNFVAVDEFDAEINPLFTTFGRFATRTSSSSATLQELEDIRYASFRDQVTVDAINGTAGTAYPAGTGRQPVNNLTDAKAIAAERGFAQLRIIGDFNFISTDTLTGFRVVGDGTNRSAIDFHVDAVLDNCSIIGATITGILDNDCRVQDCVIDGCDLRSGKILDSWLKGTISVGGTPSQIDITNCQSFVAGTATPILDMTGLVSPFSLRGYNGGIELRNKTNADPISLDIHSGQIILDSTVTTGTIVCRGVGKLIDNSVGATVVDELVSGLRQVTMDTRLFDLFQNFGLDIANPLVLTSVSQVAGGVNISITEAPAGTVTVARS
jgi:hypothetical protein